MSGTSLDNVAKYITGFWSTILEYVVFYWTCSLKEPL